MSGQIHEGILQELVGESKELTLQDDSRFSMKSSVKIEAAHLFH
jgi:hypothetical protein